MKHFFIATVLIFAGFAGFGQEHAEDRIYDYIDRYQHLAMAEMKAYKIPASITLAQAIYASGAGAGKTAREANNHFGITCHQKEWQGPTYYESENRGPDYCMRKYATAEESYRDHSLFLAKRARYRELFLLPEDDYTSWAQGLKALGYSGSPAYADTLVALIVKYNLSRFDRKVLAQQPSEVTASPVPVPASDGQPREMAPDDIALSAVTQPEEHTSPAGGRTGDDEATAPETAAADSRRTPEDVHVFTLDPRNVPYKSAYFPYTSRPVYENNRTKFILARKGDTYHSLAASLMMKEDALRSYNDVYDESEPIAGEVVYVQMKSSRSPVDFHKLEPGDTFRYISQLYGVQLKLVIKRNKSTLNNYSAGDKVRIGGK